TNLLSDRRAVFVLIGSHPKGMDAMVEHIKARAKGTDMLDRVPVKNRFEIPAPVLEDKAVIVASHVVDAAAARGEPVDEIEKLALYYALSDPSFSTPRQLKDLAVAAVQSLPKDERRLMYDDLFSRGDSRNHAFWEQHKAAAKELSGTYVAIG
ncbi:hydrolase or acyltransferase, partial [mine drainage metagenome]